MKSLRNPEYAKSGERLNFLRDAVIDGEDATAVLKYAKKFRDDTVAYTIELLRTSNDPKRLEDAARTLKVVEGFCDMLEHAVKNGEHKRKLLEEITK